jgi:hypothetical protein
VAGPLDALDADVEAFGRAVAGAGVMVGEDLGSPRSEGLTEGAISSTSSARQPAMVLSISIAPLSGVVGEVEVAHGLLLLNRT